MDRESTPLGSLNVSPQSRRVVEASIAANTSGLPFWALHVFLFCLVGILAIVAWGATAWALMATLDASELGVEALGIPFFGMFAIVATIVWGVEIRFLRHALRAAT